MRHRIAGFKLGRDTEHRRAMWRNMAISLFTHGQITTTIPKAKSLRPLVEKMITTARRGDLAARRRVVKQLGNPVLVDFDPKDLDKKDLQVKRSEGYKINRYREVTEGPRVVSKLFNEIAPSYQDRNGGYTRIIRLGQHRIGDGADLCVLQLVGREEGGPQVSGQYSRRRDKANHRMEVAARYRKSAAAAQEKSPETAAVGGEDGASDAEGGSETGESHSQPEPKNE